MKMNKKKKKKTRNKVAEIYMSLLSLSLKHCL